MKKRYLSLLTGAIACLALTSCDLGTVKEYDFQGKGYTDYDYLALKHVLENVGVGETKALDIDVYPVSYKASSLTFTSSDTSVATVNAKGEVKGLKQGVVDIEITSKDELFSNHVRVAVTTPSSKTGVKTALNNINAIYSSASYESPTKALRYEYSIEDYYCEGVLDHGMESYEVMGFNEEDGYFFVEGPTVYFKTQHGAPEVKNGKWIFCPVKDVGYQKTRIIHITPTAKTYFDLNTSNYDYENPSKITRDIMNFFFVSGEQIIDSLVDGFDGKDDFTDLTGESITKFYAIDDNSVYFSYGGSDTGYTVDVEDELEYFDIPAGTSYDIKMQEDILNQNGRTRGLDLTYNMMYELEGKSWQRDLKRSQIFEPEFEEFILSDDDAEEQGYTQVDSFYDL